MDPELLRDYDPRTVSRVELDAARRSFVYEALDRKLTRVREADQNIRYASAEELLTPVIRLLAELPRRPDCPDPEMERLIDTWAATS